MEAKQYSIKSNLGAVSKVALPFYAPPSSCQKTSAEIINEAKAAINGTEQMADNSFSCSSLRPLNTQRPFTPKDKERILFGKKKKVRPPSSFSLRYLQFENPDVSTKPIKDVSTGNSKIFRTNSSAKLNSDKIFNLDVKEYPVRRIKLPSIDNSKSLQKQKNSFTTATSLDCIMQEMTIDINEDETKNTCQCFSDYCASSSVHGVQYIGDRKRSLLVRITWALIFLTSISWAVYSIMDAYDKWVTSPIIVTFHEKSMPSWKIPFPSVTVCPSIKINQSVFNISEFQNKAEEHKQNPFTPEVRKFEILNTMCSEKSVYLAIESVTMAIVYDFIEVTPNVEEMIGHCQWGSNGSDCAKNFSRILTEDGVCYTFNMLHPEEFFTKAMSIYHGFEDNGYKSSGWTLDDGYPQELKVDTYPRRALGANLNLGLIIILVSNIKEQDDYCDPVEGYKVALHNPATLPILSKGFIRIPYDQQVEIVVKPEVITTAEKLRRYSYYKRYCYFFDERRLKFYKTYTQSNCEMECLANFTRKKCGCVAYYMPHKLHTPICGSAKIACLETAERDLRTSELEKEVSHEEKETEKGTCNCLPSCTSIVYQEDVTQAPINKDKLHRMYSFPKDVMISEVSIIMAENQFIATRRNELYGVTDFIANCGGLLGLFMGFSLLSFVEILYHLLLGIYTKLKVLMRRHKRQR